MDHLILEKRRSHIRARRNVHIDQFVALLVCNEFDVTMNELRHESRSVIRISHARQVFMYLLHTVLLYSMTDAGKFVGRDRTTVRHASVCVEDMREKKEFDEKIERMTTKIQSEIQISNVG